MTADIIDKNGEILFLYDAENCNPNGDPDNENKPRMDYTTSTNLVSDVRLKRYIRDYLEQHKEKEIYLTNPHGFVLNAKDRLLFWLYIKRNNKVPADIDKDIRKNKDLKISDIKAQELIESFIDLRLFGATIPIKASTEGGTGSSFTLIGPVQFNWGKSLNEVEIVPSSGITSHLSSEKGTQGTMGTDYRVFYSFLGFHGIISAIRAKKSGLTWDDITLLDEAMIKAIPSWVTRTKIDQYPRLYLRVCYNSNNFFIGDLRKYVKLNKTTDLRSIKDVSLDLTELKDLLVKHQDHIESIYYYCDDNIKDAFNIILESPLKSKLKELKI